MKIINGEYYYTADEMSKILTTPPDISALQGIDVHAPIHGEIVDGISENIPLRDVTIKIERIVPKFRKLE